MTKTAKDYRIEWRPKAVDDLRAIVAYIGKDNPVKAREFGQLLRNKVDSLARHPESGRSGWPGLPKYVRELIVHPNYIVFYRLRAATRIAEILRIKHVAQQMP